MTQEKTTKPRLLFLRFTRQNLPEFICLHLREQVMCLSQFFDVTVIDHHPYDYRQLCDKYKPDITIFESGIYVGRRAVKNVSAYPEIPKLGFIHCDAYCQTREYAIYDMARWGITTFFTTSVSLGSYTPAIADKLFVWPNFVDPEVFHDYGLTKVIPVLFTGSQEISYPWRNRINKIISQHYPTLQSPHFGWTGQDVRMPNGKKYARIINASLVAPTCGSIANEVVRKHFEIPACNTCLITQRTPAIEAAGFSDLVNCVFADEDDIIDKLDWLFHNPEELDRITRAGKEFIDSHHTIRNRDQVFQWYNLYKQLKPGQRIVQLGPFLPLKIVDEISGVKNKHVASKGVDRLLMVQGDEKLLSCHYEDAEILYRKCLNYHKMPEPVLRLAICRLGLGDPGGAIDILTRQILEVLENQKEPDPNEWAYFIISFLCRGQLGEALIRSNQFKMLHSQELDRIRTVVRLLNGQMYNINHLYNVSYRLSIHQLPKQTIEDWTESLCKMLKVCQQSEIAERLKQYPEILKTVETEKYEISWGKGLNNRGVEGGFVIGPVRIIDNLVIALVKLWRRVKNVILPPLVTMEMLIGPFLPYKFSAMGTTDNSIIIRRLLRSDDIKSVLLLGASTGSWLTEAFLSSIDENPSIPSAVCMNYQTHRFMKLQKLLATRKARVRCIYMSDENMVDSEKKNEKFDVVIIDCSELGKNIGNHMPDADMVIIDDINLGIGYDICQRMLADRNYSLFVHETAYCGGFAIFIKVIGSYKSIHISGESTQMSNKSIQKCYK